jgi:uncharacterized membrane-anchored protein
MKKITITLLTLFGIIFSNYAQKETAEIDYEAIEAGMKYQTGKIKLSNATLNIPKGFKFLDAKQAQYVMKDLWKNPEDLSLLGALVPENNGVIYSDSWLFTIHFDEMGFVKDEDANETDYDELLTSIKADFVAQNPERIKQGFGSSELIGWASKPFYDKEKKVLHWAKEIKFDNDSINTLNYDLRVLGRKGVYIVSAVAAMKQLPEVKANINSVISSIEFDSGNKYSDFDDTTDTVAEWTIGGLIAGKILAKVGFFAIIAKFGKVIFLAFAGGLAAVKKFFFGNTKS